MQAHSLQEGLVGALPVPPEMRHSWHVPPHYGGPSRAADLAAAGFALLLSAAGVRPQRCRRVAKVVALAWGQPGRAGATIPSTVKDGTAMHAFPVLDTPSAKLLEQDPATWQSKAFMERHSGLHSVLTPWPLPRSGDASGAVVARLLEVVFRMMLESYGRIAAEVSSSIGRLSRGGVLGARVVGSDLRTPLGLTARELQVLLPDGARLDSRALFHGKLALADPTRGLVEIVFDEDDFAQFLAYPQVASAARSATSGRFAFARDGGVEIGAGGICFHGRADPEAASGGSKVMATLAWPLGREGLRRGLPGWAPSVTVLEGPPERPDARGSLKSSLTDFFQGLTLDLVGMRLRPAAMEPVLLRGVSDGAGCGRPAVRLQFEGEICRVPDPLREQM